MSLFRRAGALISRFFTSAADPAATPGELQLYSKVDGGGISQLYGRSDDGTIHQITPPSAGGGGSGTFGTGRMGNLVFDGTTTISVTGFVNIVPSAMTYTLNQDIFANDITVDTGVTINTAGYRIFALGTLTLSGTALIHRNGNAGGNATDTTAGAAGAALAQANLPGSTAGVLGGGAGSSGNTGLARGNVPRPGLAGNGGVAANGGTMQGGGGGNGWANDGGGRLGGSNTLLTALQGLPDELSAAIRASTIGWPVAPSVVFNGGSSGGSGNGGIGTINSGGGGGSGSAGGFVVVCARVITGTGNIECKGGAGGNGGVGTGTGAGHCGGGGGGGAGGIIVLATSSASFSNYSVAGGAAGLKGAAIGVAADGGSGGEGLVYRFLVGG